METMKKAKTISVALYKRRQLAFLSTALIAAGIDPGDLRYSRRGEVWWMLKMPNTRLAMAVLHGFLAGTFNTAGYMLGAKPDSPWSKDFPSSV